MSSSEKGGEKESEVKENTACVCVEEAAALLNCVAAKSYNEMKCIPLLKKLRTCIEKKNVVDFTLHPDTDPETKPAEPLQLGTCMAFLYARSTTWRKIVNLTRSSPWYMGAFAVACFGVPYAVGKVVMWGTNPPEQQELERMLRARQTVDHQVLARVNRERLAVLLGEAERKDAGEDRYAAALRGQSLGTHSRGSTVDAKGIEETPRKEETR